MAFASSVKSKIKKLTAETILDKVYHNDPSLSPNTIFEITATSVLIKDSEEGYSYTYPGGIDNFIITISNSGTKKNPRKSITIKRLLPRCAITALPVITLKIALDVGFDTPDYHNSPDRSYEFKQGYAYNEYRVDVSEHHKFKLNPTLYCSIGKLIHTIKNVVINIYLIVPIIDGRYMQSEMKDALYNKLGNQDIVNLIEEYYNKLAKKDTNFDFHMEDTAIIPGVLYHKRALVNLFIQGKVKFALSHPSFPGINVLEPDSYNHFSIYGTPSPLKNLFSSCDDMKRCLQTIIEKFIT